MWLGDAYIISRTVGEVVKLARRFGVHSKINVLKGTVSSGVTESVLLNLLLSGR